MAVISVKMLGSFEIISGAERFDLSVSKSKKGWMLAKYLLYNKNRSVPNEELTKVLWPESEDGGHENALKTSISRLRSFFSQVDPRLNRLILTGDAAYFINPDIDIEVDALTLQSLGANLASIQTLTDAHRAEFTLFLSLYRGIFLPADGRDGDNWVIARREALSNLYLSTLYHYLELLKQAKDDETLLNVCRDALEIVAYDDKLQEMMMDALYRTRRGPEARLQSRRDSTRPTAPLAEGMQTYYHKINQLNRMLESDIDKIREDLVEGSARRGAFFCEYNFFREIQYVQKRHLERLGASLFIALMALTGKGGVEIEPNMLTDAMDALKEILMSNLRMGDTVAQHGAAQYVLLLPTVNNETGIMIMKRVITAFNGLGKYHGITCEYTVSPIIN